MKKKKRREETEEKEKKQKKKKSLTVQTAVFSVRVSGADDQRVHGSQLYLRAAEHHRLSAHGRRGAARLQHSRRSQRRVAVDSGADRLVAPLSRAGISLHRVPPERAQMKAKTRRRRKKKTLFIEHKFSLLLWKAQIANANRTRVAANKTKSQKRKQQTQHVKSNTGTC